MTRQGSRETLSLFFFILSWANSHHQQEGFLQEAHQSLDGSFPGVHRILIQVSNLKKKFSLPQKKQHEENMRADSSP